MVKNLVSIKKEVIGSKSEDYSFFVDLITFDSLFFFIFLQKLVKIDYFGH